MDIRYHLPNVKLLVIFDIGANVGQSAKQYLNAAPEARIRAFEPVGVTFRELQAAIGTHERVTAERLGFSDRSGTAAMEIGDMSTFAVLSAAGSHAVTLTTLDSYCARQKVDRIDFLKIDTEGHDLKVLQGAKGLLERDAVTLIQVEAGTNPENNLHVPLDHFLRFLEPCGYRLFGFYDQVGEWPTGQPNLRRVNAVFVSSSALAQNPKRPASWVSGVVASLRCRRARR